MKTFKKFIAEMADTSALHPSVMGHVNDFVRWGNSKEGIDRFGATLADLHAEPGCCSMVANDLTSHLRRKGVDAKTITGSNPTNPKWNEVKDDEGVGGFHTVTQVGNHVVDLTRGQFDKNAKKIHVQHIDDFKREWGHTE